ncbi:MAG: retropepsin-like aspartic protease, partial [Bacteroidota bacterium]
MVQAQGETCQQWLKRLQEVSPDCEFVIPCTHSSGQFHKFDDTILRTKFILGMHNAHIKQELLSKSLELPSLNDVFNHATRMEATSLDMEQTASGIAEIKLDHEAQMTEDGEVNRISSYRKLHKSTGSTTTTQGRSSIKPCDGCGSTQHTSEERPAKCPAWKKACNRCKRKGHFATVCRSYRNSDQANALIAEVNTKEVSSNEIQVHITAMGEHKKQDVPIMVFPDTGATLCVAGVSVLPKLGITIRQLKSTSRQITTATGGRIYCLGWFQAKLSIGQYQTVQEVYVCKSINRVFLSKAGCIELGNFGSMFWWLLACNPRGFGKLLCTMPSSMHPALLKNTR